MDPASGVRRLVAGLCEEVAVPRPVHLVPCLSAVRTLLQDSAPLVVKRAVIAGAATFKEALVQAALRGAGPSVPANITAMWDAAKGVRDEVRNLLLSGGTNDGVRLQAVKFIEGVVLLCHGKDWGADAVSDTHATLNMDDLAADADNLVSVLLELLSGGKMAGTVTIVMISAATNISIRVPFYLIEVLPALLGLATDHAAAAGQTSAAVSLGKELRSSLLQVLRSGLPEAESSQAEVVEALRALGAGDQASAALKHLSRSAAGAG